MEGSFLHRVKCLFPSPGGGKTKSGLGLRCLTEVFLLVMELDQSFTAQVSLMSSILRCLFDGRTKRGDR